MLNFIKVILPSILRRCMMVFVNLTSVIEGVYHHNKMRFINCGTAIKFVFLLTFIFEINLVNIYEYHTIC